MLLDIQDPTLGRSRFLGRYRKPNFKYQSAKSIVVPGSASAPAYYVIGGNVYEVSKDLECNLTVNGAGGLAATLSLTASTVYYLYGILSGGQVKLIADSEPPTLGPQDFTNWTYLGAFRTWGSSNVSSFISIRGVHRMDPLATEQTVTSATISAKTFVMPITAYIGYFRGTMGTINAAGDALSVASINSAGSLLEILSVGSTTASSEPREMFEVAILTPRTIYAAVTSNSDVANIVLCGWTEDPSEYL